MENVTEQPNGNPGEQGRSIEEIKADLLILLNHMRSQAVAHKEEGKEFELALLNCSGSGKKELVFTFLARPFIEDMARLLGAPPLTKQDMLGAKALEFLQLNNLKAVPND